MKKIYPRTGDTQTVYLNAVVKDPSIEVGDYTIYNDFVSNPLLFEQNNVLYRKPPVIHVFSATLSISIFVPQNEAYDDTRRSCRNYYVLQGTQSNL